MKSNSQVGRPGPVLRFRASCLEDWASPPYYDESTTQPKARSACALGQPTVVAIADRVMH